MSTDIRVGSGIDVHAFGPGDSLVLGGVRIAHTRGVVAHSDGDVLLHDSRRFVAAVLTMLERRLLRVVNADLTLLAQQPRLAPWREQIRHSIATMLGVELQCINLKATTTEHLGFLGRNEGLMAMATVLLSRASPAAPLSPDAKS